MNQEHGLKFAGTVFARLKGTATWFELGNTTSLTISTSSEKDERISFKKDSFGQALDSLATPNPPEIAWENDTFNKRNFAFMLMGEAKDLSTSTKQVSNEPITLKKGEWVKLPHENIDPEQECTVVLDSGSKTVAKSDYTINYNLGLIMLHADSSEAEGTAQASYTLREGGGFVIDAATLDSLALELMIDGKNRVTGENAVLKVWEANVSADGDFDWLNGDWGKAKFKGSCITPSNQKSPYQLQSFAV